MKRVDVPPGTIFGRLTVIEEAPRVRVGTQIKRAMLCQCECGTEKVVQLGHLTTGHTTSCGCLSLAFILPGTVFGRWTVIHEEPPTASGQRTMLCQCECGTQGIVHVGNLRRGGSQSCGCARGAVVDTSRLQPGEVALHGKDARGRVALVDVADYELVMQYRWRLVERSKGTDRRADGPYARTTLPRSDDGKVTHLYMHVLIMGRPYIDHANGNGLDCRRSNLRPATVSQNSANRPGHSSSGFKGVHWVQRSGRWIARINANGQRRSLGCFDDPADAARAYDAAALEAYGEFAWLNFPGPVA